MCDHGRRWWTARRWTPSAWRGRPERCPIRVTLSLFESLLFESLLFDSPYPSHPARRASGPAAAAVLWCQQGSLAGHRHKGPIGPVSEGDSRGAWRDT
jgi:hypothetical protein